jgi:hypothetical protein
MKDREIKMKNGTVKYRPVRFLKGYYCLLQITHLFFLSRAGLIVVTAGRYPFPASPPVDGWNDQVIPFLIAMGGLDALAAALTLAAGYREFILDQSSTPMWLISLTAALTSALIFTAGTWIGGAWHANPWEYGLLVPFFTPLFVLYGLLVRSR